MQTFLIFCCAIIVIWWWSRRGVLNDPEHLNAACNDNDEQRQKITNDDTVRKQDDQAFQMAVNNGDLRQLKNLLDKGVNIDARNFSGGETAIIVAAGDGNKEIVDLLIRTGADLNSTGNYRNTALMQAAEWDHREVATLLVKNGADINMADENGITALMRAAKNRHTDMAVLLIKNGADVNALDAGKQTPFILAVENGLTDLTARIIDNGADLTWERTGDAFNDTPVLHAVRHQQTSLATLLIKRGAEIAAHDSFGLTALELARERDMQGVIALLIKNGADAGQTLPNWLCHETGQLVWKNYDLRNEFYAVAHVRDCQGRVFKYAYDTYGGFALYFDDVKVTNGPCNLQKMIGVYRSPEDVEMAICYHMKKNELVATTEKD